MWKSENKVYNDMTISMNTTARESTRAKNITRNDNINEHNS